ncbi:phosphodiester glycosidase family protein, partial [Vallitalea sediminicola]
SVFEHTLYDQYDGGYKICNPKDLKDEKCHYNHESIGRSTYRNLDRTFLGHATDGSFYMVCASPGRISLPVGAKLMLDLGCDYAVNMDGSRGMKMRVASGYTNGFTPGKMTPGGTNYFGEAVCAYKK